MPSYSNYEDILKVSNCNSYNDEELAEVVFKKTLVFLKKIKSEVIQITDTDAYSLLAVINPILENKTNCINILDFGGACGAHYFQLRSLIENNISLNWVVVETSNMVKYGKKLETEELSFCENISDAIEKLGHFDLIHTSGTLHCLSTPQIFLSDLLNCNSKWLLFNRLVLNEQEKDIFTIYSSMLSWNGIGELPKGHVDRIIKYPFFIFSERRFYSFLNIKYKVIAKFNERTRIYSVKSAKIVSYGILCKLK